MEDKSRVMISYRGTAEELEKEFERKINYLGQSSSIDSIKFLWKRKSYEYTLLKNMNCHTLLRSMIF